MTKKDYIQFASLFQDCHTAIRTRPATEEPITAEGMLRAIERDVADIFMADNPRFDYARFMEAIGHE